MFLVSEKYYSILAGNKSGFLDGVKKFNNLYFNKNNITRINENYYLLGDIDYILNENKSERIPYTIESFQKLLYKYDDSLISEYIDGDFVLLKIGNDCFSIYPDIYSKKDVFYLKDENDFVISDSLEVFFELRLAGEFDRVSLTSFFLMYGNYSPKKDTIYKNIFRLGVNEILIVSGTNFVIKAKEYEPLKIQDYNENHLELYYKILWDAIKFRSSSDGINWIYLSSGWDSTAILGFLREMYPAEQIRCVIGRMLYSKRSGVINQFEIDRASAMAEYYNVKLDIVDLDYTSDNIISYFKNIVPFLKNNLVHSYNSLNFCILSDYIKNNSGKNDVVFSGEISDGVHNFGFSQYATILDHPDLNFREYADKMISYLFGPSFLKSILEGNYYKDTVYKFLKDRNGNCINYETEGKNSTEILTELLSSLFMSPRRFPFYSLDNIGILSADARNEYKETFGNKYLRKFAGELNTDNIYAIIIHLYNSFHWQGSTVKVIGKSLERYDKQIKLPFWDISIQNFLSQMPENWGRGLDLNNTKYPLKWVLKNKINYPMHLQKGPHSYLYDVDPGFNHLEETLFRSSLNSYFKGLLETNKYENILNDNYFNLQYIKEIIEKYLKDEKLSGQRLNDIGSLILLSAIA